MEKTVGGKGHRTGAKLLLLLPTKSTWKNEPSKMWTEKSIRLAHMDWVSRKRLWPTSRLTLSDSDASQIWYWTSSSTTLLLVVTFRQLFLWFKPMATGAKSLIPSSSSSSGRLFHIFFFLKNSVVLKTIKRKKGGKKEKVGRDLIHLLWSLDEVTPVTGSKHIVFKDSLGVPTRLPFCLQTWTSIESLIHKWLYTTTRRPFHFFLFFSPPRFP